MASRSERQRRARGQGRGGPRQGVQGQNYTNRSDLQQGPRIPPPPVQPPRAVPNQTYGVAGQQIAAQQQIPLPGGAGQLQPQVNPAQLQAQQLASQAQGLPGLDAPTNRPNEPVTAGIPQGAGPGPEAIAASTPQDTTLATLRGIYSRYPDPDLLSLINEFQSRPLTQSPSGQLPPALRGITPTGAR